MIFLWIFPHLTYGAIYFLSLSYSHNNLLGYYMRTELARGGGQAKSSYPKGLAIFATVSMLSFCIIPTHGNGDSLTEVII